MQAHTFSQSTLARLTVIGTVFLGILSGFGAIDTAWDFFPVLTQKARPYPTDEEVRTAESGLQRVREDLAQRQKELRLLQASKPAESSSVAQEITGLEALEYEMSRNLDSLKQRRTDARFSKTFVGRVFNWGGRLFSLYCIYRIFASLVNLILPRSPASAPGEATSTNADVISFVLAYLLSHLPFVHLQQDKIAVISRQISLGFVGIIILSSIRRVLRGVARLLRVTSRSLGASLMLLTLAQVMGIYLLSTLIQLRTSFPPPPVRPDMDADEGTVNLFSTLPEYQFFGPLFDGAFLLAAAVTAAARYVFEIGPGGFDIKLRQAPAETRGLGSARPVLTTSEEEAESERAIMAIAEKSQDTRSEKSTVVDSPTDLPYGDASHASEIALGKAATVEDFEEGGRRGWLVVLGCFIFSAATAGFALVSRRAGDRVIGVAYYVFQAWGVTEEYFRVHMFPGTSDSVLTMLGSLSSVLLTLVGVISGKLADRPFLAAGAILWVASMLASAFCTEIWQFFITMGVMQGVADALIFPIIVSVPAQWFKRYQGFATGIVVAGSSIGGAIASLIYRGLLSAVGLRTSLLIFTAIDVVSLGAAYFMIEERESASGKTRAAIVWFDVEFFRDPIFWSVAACFFFATFGYLTPIFLISTFTAEKVPGLPDLVGTLPVVVLNLSAALGRTLVGFAADIFGPVNSLLVAIVLSGLTQLVVWMFVSSYAGIMAFAILYGFFCGCLISLVSAVVVRIYGADRLAGLSGLLYLFNTPGYAAGAPLAGALLGATGNDWRVVAAYGGAVQIIGALCLIYARWKREPRLFAAY
ncbi:hypothetical protein BN946_scf184902.g20, partial [Trametes cinnabarina]